MERLIILVGRLYKSVALTKYFFKVPLVGRFMHLVGVIRRPLESLLDGYWYLSGSGRIICLLISHNVSILIGRPSIFRQQQFSDKTNNIGQLTN